MRHSATVRHPQGVSAVQGISNTRTIWSALVASLASAVLVAAEPAFIPSERILPDTTRLWVSIREPDAVRTSFNKTRLGQLLQDPFLNTLRREHIPVSIYLVNGIKLQGQIESFDQYVVLLRNTVTQMVYKHAISTVVPARAVNFQAEASAEG